MHRILELYERFIISALVLFMFLVVLLAVIDLAWTILQGLLRPPFALLALEDLLNVFGAFLLVLVGLELLETIKAYLEDHVVHAEVVIMAAMIAIARKIIVLDAKALDPLTLFGLAFMLLALAGSYFTLKRINGIGGHSRGVDSGTRTNG